MIAAARSILDRVTDWRNRGRVGALGEFYSGGGNELLVSNLDLTQTDFVVDAGGYEGEWTDEMVCRYGVSSIIFEPNPHNAELLRERYKANSRIGVIEAALSNQGGTALFKQQGSGSAIDAQGTIKVELCDVSWIRRYTSVRCLKLNVEGSEYDILERLIETKLIDTIKYILVQFHQAPNCNRRREKIQLGLCRTHECVFDYPFVWELWKLKPPGQT